MATVQRKRAKNDRFQKIYFVNFDFRNGIIRYYLVTLPIFVTFHPQTTEIQPFKVEHSSTKTVKFHHYDLNTCDVKVDFMCHVKNSLVMNYPCKKFHHYMNINKRNHLHFS